MKKNRMNSRKKKRGYARELKRIIRQRENEIENLNEVLRLQGELARKYYRDQMRDDIESAVTALCACCNCGCELNQKYCIMLNEFKKELKLALKEE